MKSYVSILLFVFCQICVTYSRDCVEETDTWGTISYFTSVYRTLHQKCWIIFVPENRFITIKNLTFNLQSQSCGNAYLRVGITDKSRENYTFCSNDTFKSQITSMKDVQIDLYFFEHVGVSRETGFILEYKIQDLECIRNDSFRCSNYSCIPKSKICDGIKDCKNGADEIDCGNDTLGIVRIEGVAEARSRAISWLKSKEASFGEWHGNTLRAITALYLANAVNLNGSGLEEQFMAKQAELKTAIALLKNTISTELLSMLINSLLVTCHSPNNFYGHNLVTRLKKQVEETSTNFAHPIAYLALCNANESWSQRASEDLKRVFDSKADYHFVKDIQAYAVMAVFCYFNNLYLSNKMNSYLLTQAKTKLHELKTHQLEDGSFGNVETTSLITQALISGGPENTKDWKMNATVKYLMKELNSTEIDFSAVYLTLPIFTGKSLTDISSMNCSEDQRRRIKGNLISDISDYVGSKINIQYSLVVGDEKDIARTLILKVPENYTAFEVMQYAGEEDYNYKFEWKQISKKIYIYKIGNVKNDPEVGKFWLMYVRSDASGDSYKHTTTNPDQIVLNDEDHLIMWYRTITI